MKNYEKIIPYLKDALRTVYCCSCNVGEQDENCVSCSIDNKTCSEKKREFSGFVNSDVKIYFFDWVINNYFKQHNYKSREIASNDAIIFEENGDITFIEFKGGGNVKTKDLRDKILSSIFFLSFILDDKKYLTNSKEWINYILVYDKDKVSFLQKNIKPNNYEKTMIDTAICSPEEMNRKCEYFHLAFFRDNIFKKTLFYNQDELIENYIDTIKQKTFESMY